MAKQNYLIQKVLAVILIVFGGFWILAAIFMAFDPKVRESAWGGLLIGAPAFLPGLIWYVNIKKKIKTKETQSIEKIILKFIRNVGGIVTVEMVAADTDLSLHEVERELQLLVTKGVATVEVNDEGIIEYRIASLTGKQN